MSRSKENSIPDGFKSPVQVFIEAGRWIGRGTHKRPQELPALIGNIADTIQELMKEDPKLAQALLMGFSETAAPPGNKTNFLKRVITKRAILQKKTSMG